ncbi:MULTISPECIES: hypothetical protein [unclassified Oceanobacter]|jgi:hypothetical protein|uniref:hypothetical protein n=1 Tax=unclassified Oceanobacter TaxID=2620260 RepID=UPI0026E415A2|nr:MULTISPECIES: hypothetical protein [unclassified Oceanobacter]MDO6682321.1 hypothetical protein [Oceanobacter sp. 5_MG-2023]MDP2506043.1 hypothetical protein [Oceanobacter sp. 3_MG-2023]MDP2547622.1 hypothetical protein [Oceanobacter sp. 4_MG-2023]MDP2608996.1 hypothetical protein [Oceanobacter sp. 1_MG-2023]MDP2612019.1 hypothetical protein [Oceanobacter sp. 2_MG-2023]
MAARDFRYDWWSKSLSGIIAGFLLALGISGLFAWWGPGGIDATNKVQFNMWLIVLVWVPLLATVYLFRNGVRAWLVLGSLALISHTALYFVRTGGMA